MKLICMLSLMATAMGGSAIYLGTDSALIYMLTILMLLVTIVTALMDA